MHKPKKKTLEYFRDIASDGNQEEIDLIKVLLKNISKNILAEIQNKYQDFTIKIEVPTLEKGRRSTIGDRYPSRQDRGRIFPMKKKIEILPDFHKNFLTYRTTGGLSIGNIHKIKNDQRLHANFNRLEKSNVTINNDLIILAEKHIKEFLDENVYNTLVALSLTTENFANYLDISTIWLLKVLEKFERANAFKSICGPGAKTRYAFISIGKNEIKVCHTDEESDGFSVWN
jgi:hypothetical protein